MEKETTPTPIEKWIEESRNKSWPKQKGLSVTACNRTMAKKVAYTKGCKELLSYLGLSDIPDPKKWVEEIKGYKEITGFETPSELAAYEKGREHEEKTIVKFIQDWKGETNSGLGQLLADKVQAENENLKKALGRIYTMDTSFENYINAQIAGEAIK